MNKIYVALRSDTIQKYLLRNNMSLRQLSHFIGYDSGQLCNWLSGKRFIGHVARKKIQEFLKMEWDDLFVEINEGDVIKKELER